MPPLSARAKSGMLRDFQFAWAGVIGGTKLDGSGAREREPRLLPLLSPGRMFATMLAIRLSLGLLLCASCASAPGPSLPALLEDPLAEPGIVTLIFVRSDCPIANRYAPTIRALQAEHAARGVRFVLVYPDADATEALIARHREAYDLPPDALRDPRHEWVERTGVSVTPEVAVFDAQRRLVYRGRIDDRFPMLGAARAQAEVHDLDLVLEALERGEAPEFTSRPAIGCPIPTLAPR